MTVLTVLTGVGGCLALAAAGAFLLPRYVNVERQATIDAQASEIIALAASNKSYQHFNPYLAADPGLKISHFGPDTGVGSGFHFDGKDGKGSQTVSGVSAFGVRYDIDLGAMGQPTQQIGVAPAAQGTHVTWTMNMDLGFNPIARVMGLFMDGIVGKTLEQGLENMAAAT